MEQLKMVRTSAVLPEARLPEGYTIRAFRDGDEEAWCACCLSGQLGVEGVHRAHFDRIMRGDIRVQMHNVFFVVAPDGEIAGTTTFQQGTAPEEGTVHMVAMREEYRGLGLALPLLLHVVAKIQAAGKKRAVLTTDDWRIPAIRTYLRAGFVPVRTGDGMEQRWRDVMARIEAGQRV